jgi:hypothetical protein
MVVEMTEEEKTDPYTKQPYGKFNLDTIRKLCTAKGVVMPNTTGKADSKPR